RELSELDARACNEKRKKVKVHTELTRTQSVHEKKNSFFFSRQTQQNERIHAGAAKCYQKETRQVIDAQEKRGAPLRARGIIVRTAIIIIWCKSEYFYRLLTRLNTSVIYRIVRRHLCRVLQSYTVAHPYNARIQAQQTSARRAPQPFFFESRTSKRSEKSIFIISRLSPSSSWRRVSPVAGALLPLSKQQQRRPEKRLGNVKNHQQLLHEQTRHSPLETWTDNASASNFLNVRVASYKQFLLFILANRSLNKMLLDRRVQFVDMKNRQRADVKMIKYNVVAVAATTVDNNNDSHAIYIAYTAHERNNISLLVHVQLHIIMHIYTMRSSENDFQASMRRKSESCATAAAAAAAQAKAGSFCGGGRRGTSGLVAGSRAVRIQMDRRASFKLSQTKSLEPTTSSRSANIQQSTWSCCRAAPSVIPRFVE
ncbi:unnamed protein product, partial [Trichogramma brassicae]